MTTSDHSTRTSNLLDTVYEMVSSNKKNETERRKQQGNI
jgi:hypothetical protein